MPTKDKIDVNVMFIFFFQYNCCSLEIKQQDMIVAIRQAGRLLS